MDGLVAKLGTIPEDYLAISLKWLGSHAMNFFIALLLLSFGWYLAKRVSKKLAHGLEKAEDTDKTLAPVISQLVRYAVFIVFIIAALGQLGIQTTSILAVLGAAGIAIALALQGTLANIAAGLMLLWLRPFSAGHFISANGIEGVVQSIGLFATRLRTVDGLYVFTPNAKLWDATITNYSREAHRRIDLLIGISYSDNIDDARRFLLELARKNAKILAEPEPVVVVDELADSAIVLRLRLWTRTSDYWALEKQLNEDVKTGLEAVGISFPFPQMDVHLER